MDFDPVIYSETLLNPFVILKLHNFDPLMTVPDSFFRKRKRSQDDEDEQELARRKKLSLIDKFQNEMDYLFYEWNSIHIVLESIRNAYSVKNITPEYLDEVDKELSVSYDELKAQVRHLERRLKKMSIQINQHLIRSPTTTLAGVTLNKQ